MDHENYSKEEGASLRIDERVGDPSQKGRNKGWPTPPPPLLLLKNARGKERKLNQGREAEESE